jgi:hypothetical protein
MSEPGTPDIIGVLMDGRFFAIEVKGSEGKATPAQLDTLAKIKRAKGAVAVIAYGSADVGEAFNV